MLAVRDFRELVRIRVLRRGLPRAVECPKPSSERQHDNDDDVSATPERRRRIWRSPAEPKEACNLKDLKVLKCRYTFGIRALNSLRKRF